MCIEDSKMEALTIGKLAKEAGVGVETIRFYEREALIKRPQTKRGAYRVYPSADIPKIRFIKRAQELGFTLKEIKVLLSLDQNTRATCEDVAKKAEEKRQEIRVKMGDLLKMERALTKLIGACRKTPETMVCCKLSDCFEDNCH